jgi:hypothetical protein
VVNKSVGNAFAVLKGYRNGNPEEAANFLNSMPLPQLRERNRQESRLRNKLRKNHKPGQRRR